MLTYETGTLLTGKVLIWVKLDGTRVGCIRGVEGGYRYYPKNAHGQAGDIMPTVAAVKRSLEGEPA